jgi:hypothetical protein
MTAAILRRIGRLESRRPSSVVVPPDALELAALAGIEPDPWQAQILQSASGRICMLAARQTGKSTVAALVALAAAMRVAGAIVLIVSPSERQSKLLLDAITRLFRRAGRPVPAVSEGKLSIELANGSAIHALPGDEATIRGYSGVAMIVVDEAARVPDGLYQTVRPMLAVSGGTLVLLSTPWGKRGFFWHEWTNGGPGWHRSKVRATECPRIARAFLEEERRAVPEAVYASEYDVEFVDRTDQLIGTELALASLSDAVMPLFPVLSGGVRAPGPPPQAVTTDVAPLFGGRRATAAGTPPPVGVVSLSCLKNERL